MKTCSACQLTKTLSAFRPEKANKDGYCGQCRDCQREYRSRHYQMTKAKVAARCRVWYQSNLEKMRDNALYKLYGITTKEYNELLKKQEGVCAICKGNEKEIDYRTGRIKNLSVDHDHITGVVRGLLCQSCNRFVGKIETDSERMLQALEYLKTYGKQ